MIIKACYILWALLICAGHANACTIFMTCIGSKVLVGNNEDYTPSAKSWLWIRPKIQSANGYVLWGFKEQYPEGGMNDKGLFIDAAALPEKTSILKDPNKPAFEGYIIEKVLRESSSVKEAVDLMSRFNLTWQEKAQIMVVDKSGDYAVIHANYIIRKTTPSFVLTNYSIAGQAPGSSTCWRRNTVEEKLRENRPSLDLFRESLAKTAQNEPDNATVYSQVCDLEEGTISLYQKHNFDKAATISLPALLQKGRRDIAINTLFPSGIGEILTGEIQQYGLAPALARYAHLKKSGHDVYDFSERELDNAAYGLLNAHKFDEAIAVFKLNIDAYPSSANAKAGLANALLLKGDFPEADEQYLKVGLTDPSNYYLNLFSQQKDNLISFVLPGFDGAKAVTVFLKNIASGELRTQGLKSTTRGKWETSVTVPPGQYTYSFQVDDSFVIDPGNKVLKPSGPYLNSFLISR